MSKLSVIEGAGGYALYHSIGIYPNKAEELQAELARHAHGWTAVDGSQWKYAGEVWGEFMQHWRELINAPPHTLTTSENVTASLYSFLGALPPESLEGKRVLIDGDCFPSMHFLLARLSERMRFTLETVPIRPDENYVLDDDIIEAWGEDVALALLTWVTSVTSRKCDLQRLVAHGRRMGSLIGVDTTQAIGIRPYDVTQPEVDFMIASSLKWVCGVPGAGVLYVREPLIAQCRPEFCGWFSHENPFNWHLDEFEYASDARRFGHGTPAVVTFAACLPGLRWHRKEGLDRLHAWNVELGSRLMAAGQAGGWDIVTPPEPEQRGGSVMLRLPEMVNPGDVLEAFRAHNCTADSRGQIIRISPGAVTTVEGVDTMIGVLNEQLQAARSS